MHLWVFLVFTLFCSGYSSWSALVALDALVALVAFVALDALVTLDALVLKYNEE